MRRVPKDWNRKVSVSGKRILNLRYANNHTLVVADEEELLELINQVKTVSKELGHRINVSKTKVMVVGQAGCLPKSDVLREYENVNIFVFLGLTIEISVGC